MNKKLYKILYIDTSLKVYGGQKSMMGIIKGLDKKFRPLLACPQDSEVLKKISPGVKVLKLKSSSVSVVRKHNIFADLFKSLSDSFRLIKFIFSNKIDLAHVQTFKAGLLALLPCKLLGCPLIWHDRLIKFHGLWDKILIHGADKIVAISQAVAKQHLSEADPEKIEIIYNGIKVPQLNKKFDKQYWFEKFDLPQDSFIIGTVGRISTAKGQKYLIKAAAQVVKEYPQTQFLVVGDCFRPEDKRYRNYLKKLTKDLDLEDNIFFTGYVENILELTNIFDVAVTTTLDEAFGRVVVEAMSLNVSVVASRVGGIPEIIEDGKSGILVSPKDSQELAQSILDLLKNKEKRERIARRGQQRFLEKFTMKRTLQEVEKLYSKVLKDEN